MMQHQTVTLRKSQSLWNRAGSFDLLTGNHSRLHQRLNPFGTGRGLSTLEISFNPNSTRFQSLWSRAGSFDNNKFREVAKNSIVSIPLEQGEVFRPFTRYDGMNSRFNPFGTGQGLSTWHPFGCAVGRWVSIPLEQGGVFRQVNEELNLVFCTSQSL